MRNTTALLAPFLLALALPAIAAMLVDAPPPPPIPDGSLEEDGSQQKNAASGTMSLGQALYESNCRNCANRSAVAKLQWNGEEVEEVVRFLDSGHYRF